MIIIEYIVPGIVLSIMIGGGIWAYISEKKEWNNGISKKTGEPWVHFDTDSQGGRGYRSQGNGYVERTWISWPVDKKK